MTRTTQLQAAGLPLVLLGGWMTGVNDLSLLFAPSVIIAGLLVGGLLTAKPIREVRWVIYASGVIVLLLIAGAIQQWIVSSSVTGTVGIGFAAALLLSTMAAALPREGIQQGIRGIRVLALVSSGWAFIQAAMGVDRALGLLSLNPNALGGFLTITGIQWLVAGKGSKGSWLGGGLILAGVPFTGSRWAMVVLGVVIIALLSRRAVSARGGWTLIAIAALAGIMFAIGAGRMDALLTSHDHIADIVTRQSLLILPGLMPEGFLGHLLGDGAHNIFTRAAVEAGWIGVGLFTAVLALAFARAKGVVRLGLGMLIALGLMDYYVWGPFQLAPLLWAYVGLGVQGAE